MPSLIDLDPEPPKPAASSPFDDSQKRWATYIGMLKLDIGLAGALLGVCALVFSDPSKIPEDSSKWILAGVSVAALLSMGFCLAAIIWINRLVIDFAVAVEEGAPGETYTRLNKQASLVSFITRLGFLCLVLSGLCIVGFIFVRANHPATAPPPVTDELAKIRQEQTTAAQGLQSTLATGIAGLGDKIDHLAAIQQSYASAQQQNRNDLAGQLNQINASLQLKITDLERRQGELERQLQQARQTVPQRGAPPRTPRRH